MDDQERTELILKIRVFCSKYECDNCPVSKICDKHMDWMGFPDDELLQVKKIFSEAEKIGGDRKQAEPTPQILDSGDRTEYSTGAVRDCKEGKGRCDLMPLDSIAQILGNAPNCEDGPAYDAILHRINWFKEDGQTPHLSHVINYFCHGVKCSTTEEFLLEVSKHFEEGAKKYGPNNWQKGIPVHSYIDSAVRHYLKYRAGWTDENHDRAFVWNLMCCIWTMKHHPELDDFTEKKEAAGNE